MRLVLLGHGVVRVIGGEQRDLQPPRELDQLRMQSPLVRDPVILDLDVEVPVSQDGPIVVGGLLSALLVTLGQSSQDLAGEA